MSRYEYNWYPLAFEDPVPGDPAAVRAGGQEYQQVAEQIATAAEELRAIGSGFRVCSEAVEEVEAKALRLADTIERAHGRYAAAGTALVGYADGLARAQELSLRAREQAVAAVSAQENAQEDLWYFQRREFESQDEPEVARQFATQVSGARASMLRADRQLEDARVLLDSARVIRDEAAQTARDSISAVVRADDLHDSVWQDIGGGFQESGLAVWNSLDEVAVGAGIAALALCWVPGVNVALAAVATIAGAVVLVRDGINLATGNGSWAEVGWSALGVISFGIGRLATKGLRMAADANRASQGLRTATNATDEAVDAAQATTRATASASSDAGSALSASPRVDLPSRFWDSGELWGTLRPSSIVSDLASDLRGGAQLFRPSTYAAATPGLHTTTTVTNPFVEARTAVSTTWSQNRTAAIYQVLGNEGAARDAAFLAQYGDPANAWLIATGATQVGELALAGRDTVGLANP